MYKDYHLLWLDGVFDDDTVHAFRSISPASNFWQKGFLEGLCDAGAQVAIVGYPAERVWPFGRFFVGKTKASLLSGFDGSTTGYLNLPGIRLYSQYIALRKAALLQLNMQKDKTDYSVVFSCLESADEETPSIRVARYLRKHFGIPWICIVADGETPAGADRYIYLPWSNFQSASSLRKGIHIDGGIPLVFLNSKSDLDMGVVRESRALMYMGALTEHGGVTELGRAFSHLKDQDVELWVCGRGSNSELDRLAKLDSRIKLKGFVDAEELDRLANLAFAFVNPRPTKFKPNMLNYPSKLLHYLAYGKPVVSTFTDGMSPSYTGILVSAKDESESGLTAAMREVLDMKDEAYLEICCRVKSFNETHTWSYQIDRFLSWLGSA